MRPPRRLPNRLPVLLMVCMLAIFLVWRYSSGSEERNVESTVGLRRVIEGSGEVQDLRGTRDTFETRSAISHSANTWHQNRETKDYFDPRQCSGVRRPQDSKLVSSLGGIDMYLYEGSDQVSELVAKGAGWENTELYEILRVLSEPTSVSGTPPVFVDIGANVGWFSWNVASLGYQVYAFEGMERNINLLKATICANEVTKQNVRLYPFALGAQTQTCVMISDMKNQGDGHTVCGQATKDVIASFGSNYTVRGHMAVRRLDDLLSQDIRVMKLDVEGYEPNVLTGALRLLTQSRVMYIMTEVSNFMQTNARDPGAPGRYYHMLQGLGYRCCGDRFNGTEVPQDSVAKMAVGGVLNLYCTKSWFPMEN